MTSYVFSIIEKAVHWNKIYDIIEEKYKKEFEIIFAIRKSNPELADLEALAKKKKNVIVNTFEQNASENFMLSESIKSANGDDLVLCRDYFDYATIMSDVLVNLGKMGAQVVCYRKPQKKGKFFAFFRKIYNNIIHMIFGFSFYEGDIGLMYFNNVATSILKSLPNNILLTKINRWAGFEVSYIESDDLKKPKFEKIEGKKTSLLLGIALFLFLAFIGGIVTLSLLNIVEFMQIFGCSIGIFLSLIWVVYLVLKLAIINRVGDLKTIK